MPVGLPFADLLDLLRANGIQIGLKDYQSLGKLLARLRTMDTQTLGAAIAALLACSEQEATQIKELFQAYCSPAVPTEQKASCPPQEQAANSATTIAPGSHIAVRIRPAPANPSVQKRLTVFGSLVVALIAALMALLLHLSLTHRSLPRSPPDLAAPVDSAQEVFTLPDLAGQSRNDLGDAPALEDDDQPEPGASENRPSRLRSKLSEVKPRLRRARLIGVLVSGFGFLMMSLWLSRRRAASFPKRRQELSSCRGPAFYELKLRDLPPALARAELDHLATLFDRLQGMAGPSRVIDVRRSLQRLLRAEPAPIAFSHRKQRCALLILCDLSPEMRPFARLIDHFVNGMKARGLILRCYFFRGNADWVSAQPDAQPIRLEELLPLAEDSILLLFGNSATLYGRKTASESVWLQTLQQFPRRVGMISDLEQLPNQPVLHNLKLPLFPQSYHGLSQAARTLLHGDEQSYGLPYPSSLRPATDGEVDQLQQLVQLAPCATPELAELLRQRFEPELPEQTLLGLSARSLDRSGEKLIFATQEEAPVGCPLVPPGDPLRSALVRGYLLRVLDDSQPADPGSLAHLRWRLDRALLTLQIPDPRQVLHPQAKAELLALLRSPLATEVVTTTAQRMSAEQLPIATLPVAVQRPVVAASRSWRHWLLAIGLFVLGPLLLCAVALWSLNRLGWLHNRECLGMEGSFKGIWDLERKKSIKLAFLSTEKVSASATWKAVMRTIDEYTQDWVAMRTEVCDANVGSQPKNPVVYDLRMRCLDRRLNEVAEMVDIMSKPNSLIVDSSASAARNLTPISNCANVEALTSLPPIPDNPVTRKRIEQVLKELDEIRAVEQFGDFSKLRVRAEDAVRAAAETKYLPVQAEALFLLGEILDLSGFGKEAEATLIRAASVATKGNDNRLLAQTWILLVQVSGFRLKDYSRAQSWARLADAALARLSDPAPLRGHLLLSNCIVASQAVQNDKALENCQQSLDLREKVYGPESFEASGVMLIMAGVYRHTGQFDRAMELYQKALAIQTRFSGPYHPDVRSATRGIGLLLRDQRRYDEADIYFRKALETAVETLGPRHIRTSDYQILIVTNLISQGKLDEAEQVARSCVEIREHPIPPDDDPSRRAQGHYFLGEVLYRKGRYEEALTHYRIAHDLREHMPGRTDELIAYSLSSLGETLTAMGNLREGLPYLERALSYRASRPSNERVPVAVQALARTEFALARALWTIGRPAQKTRALELARKAQQDYQEYGTRPDNDLPLVTQWLSRNSTASSPQPRIP